MPETGDTEKTQAPKKMTRRRLLKLSAAGAGLLGAAVAISLARNGIHGQGGTTPSLTGVPVTFSVEAPGATRLELVFPTIASSPRMRNVSMKVSGSIFSATVNLPMGSLMHYQYSDPTQPFENREQFAPNQPVNRAVYISSAVTMDDQAYSFGPQGVPLDGTLTGTVLDSQTGAPVLDALIVADGMMTFPNGDGSFSISVRDRQGTVVVYLLDGSYIPQSTLAALNGPVDFHLVKAQPAKVTINLQSSPPAYHIVRIFSTAEQTGMRQLYQNDFFTQNFLPVESPLTLDLYEGQFVDYLYSVGSATISSEQSVRSFAATDGLVINDQAGNVIGSTSTQLTVSAPSFTSSDDIVGVGGIGPLLMMHPKGGGGWTLAMGPGSFSGQTYRYFKSFQGDGNEGTESRTVSSSSSISDSITSWFQEDSAVSHSGITVPQIGNGFDIFAYPYDYYSVNHALLMEAFLARTAALGLHGVVLSQIWGYSSIDPLPQVSRSNPQTLYMPLSELSRVSALAKTEGLRITLYPQMVGAESLLNAPVTYGADWWVSWLKQTGAFNMYNAQSAEAAGVDYLVLLCRQPGMNMLDSYAQTFDDGMNEIIDKMRGVFSGKIICPAESVGSPYDYWTSADVVSRRIWDGLGLPDSASQQDIDTAAANFLDANCLPIHQQSGKPFLIDQLAYFSILGALQGASVDESDGTGSDANHNYPLDVVEQQELHQAFYNAINSRSWIQGVNLFGYTFTDTSLAREISVRAKPAEDVASAWAKSIRQARGD